MTDIPLPTDRFLNRDAIAKRLAADLQPNWVVNLGIGMPTLTTKYVTEEQDIIFHSENGIIGMGPPPPAEDEDDDLRDAGKNFCTLIDGAALVHHADSFSLARGGRLDCAVLGAFQVAANGDLANWRLPKDPTGNIGGAMDIATGANEVFAMMTHTSKGGESKLAETLTYPVTALACVTRVFTDMAVISVTGDGFVLEETAPGISAEEVQAFTDAPLKIAEGLCDIAA
ncbi:MAG TPA: 3-oxoadipate CoA-transferase [Rhodospirillaceae bacterium]|nr:3-oxoadipate CoA-transferase [Rhodospirillaceae bacterium]HAT35193.1 3-oxoadipate CoA-transferase [Rhodospirillaceae bacterium]